MKVFSLKHLDSVAVLVVFAVYWNTEAVSLENLDVKGSQALGLSVFLRYRRATGGRFSQNQGIARGHGTKNPATGQLNNNRRGQTRGVSGTFTRDQGRVIRNKVRTHTQPFINNVRNMVQSPSQNIVVRKLLPGGGVGDIIKNIGDQVHHMKSGIKNIVRNRLSHNKRQNTQHFRRRVKSLSPTSRPRHSKGRRRGSFNNNVFQNRRNIISGNIRKRNHDRMIKINHIHNNNINNFALNKIPHHNENTNRINHNSAGNWNIRNTGIKINKQNNINIGGKRGILGGTRFQIINNGRNANFNSNGRHRLGGIPSGIIGGTGFPGAGFVMNKGMSNTNTNGNIERNSGNTRRNFNPSNSNLFRVNRVRQIRPPSNVHIIGPKRNIVNPDIDTEIPNVIGLASRIPSVSSQGISMHGSPNTIIIPGEAPLPFFDPIASLLLDGEIEMLPEFYPIRTEPPVYVAQIHSTSNSENSETSQIPANRNPNSKTKTIYVQNGNVVQLSPADIGQVIRIVGNHGSTSHIAVGRVTEEPDIEREERRTTTAKTPMPAKAVTKASTTSSNSVH